MNLISSITPSLVVMALLTASTLAAQTITTSSGLASAITAANASPTTATTVNLAAGTYNLTTALPSLAANSLTLQGPTMGAPAILDANGLPAGVIFNVTADHIVIVNLTLRNARTHAIAIQPGADQGLIADCVITNPTTPLPTTAAIDGNNCLNWTITGNTISGIVGTSTTAEPAIHFYGGASGTTVTNNLIKNCDRAISLGGNPTAIAPVITSQPTNAAVTAGQTATFVVSIPNTTLATLQWQVSTSGSSWDNVSTGTGATTTTYTTAGTSASDNGKQFRVIVTSGGGTTTSSQVTLTVTSSTSAPAITTQPQSTTVIEGQTASFSVSATGAGPLRYQWSKNGTPISGARFTRYTTSATSLADSTAVFSVVVTDDLGTSTISTNATLTVNAGTRRTQHYVDPVNGLDSGDGSSTKPWKTLQTVIDLQVATQTWEAPLPYTSGKKLVSVNAGAAVQAGDTIWLRSGNYGALTIASAYNSAPITVAAAPSSVPKFSNVLVQSSQNWILRGFSVSPSYATTYSADTIVTVEDHSWRGPAYDIEIDGFEIFSIPDETVWTLASDWDTKAANGVYASADRIVVHNCQLRNVNFAIAMDGKGSRVDHNTINAFCGDGMRGLGDDEVFEYNLVKNLRVVNDNHADGFQSWSTGSDGSVGTGVVKNITLRGNIFIAYENPNTPFAGGFQGIGCFDGAYENWVIENNVVLSDTYHGIALYGARNCRIVNNTVLDLDTTNTVTPWILITDLKSGVPSRDCVVRNNLTTSLNVSSDATNNIVVDHNLIVPKNPAAYFVNLAQFNVRLASGSPAIDQGSASQAPLIDADEKPRPKGTAFDLGAYEYAP